LSIIRFEIKEMPVKVLLSCEKFIVFLSVCLFFACATLPSLDVTYTSLPQSPIFEGREIHLKVIDKRANEDIIGAGAKKVYKDFSGNMSFILQKGTGERSTVGMYEVEPLFKHAFVLYLENMGLHVPPDPKKTEVPQLVIRIYDFVLDLSGSRWTSRIVYEAEFSQGEKTLIRKVQCEGEKLRVSGLTQAHQVMSETFSDIVHKLDVKELVFAIKEEK
jgi:hypothetical protein